MARVTLTLLGGFHLRGPRGRRVPVGRRKAVAVLAYLALGAGVPRARDEVAALLWPDTSDGEARPGSDSSCGREPV